MDVSYFDCIAHQAMRRPDAVAAVDLATGRRHTYRAWDRRIGSVATALQDRFGIGSGDRVAVLAMNSTDMFDIQFACWRIGAIFVPLNWRLADPELAAIMADCEPALLVFGDDFASRVAGFDGSWRTLGFGPAFERIAEEGAGVVTLPEVSMDDTATILYTSGTTGRPKGVIITHAMNTWNSVHCVIAAGLSRATVFLTVLPLFHAGGLNVHANPTFFVGGTVLIPRAFDPGETLRLFGDPSAGINCFLGVPAHYQFMCQHPAFADTDLSGLKYASVGAAPMPEAILRAWAERGVEVTQVYGMTETSPLVLALDPEDALRKMGSAGKPVLHVRTRVVDTEGNDAGPNTAGELWLKGPILTPGYWRQPETTAAAFSDGWLRTGDAVVVDDEGYYTIVDRWKDMYISGGENVYPAEVEDVLYQMDGVAEAAVIGVDDAQWGQVGRAVVVLKADQAITAAEVIAFCGPKLARFKLPRSVIFTDALPRNATGKVHKPTLRQRFGGD